jgi:hypothetical protein
VARPRQGWSFLEKKNPFFIRFATLPPRGGTGRHKQGGLGRKQESKLFSQSSRITSSESFSPSAPCLVSFICLCCTLCLCLLVSCLLVFAFLPTMLRNTFPSMRSACDDDDPDCTACAALPLVSTCLLSSPLSAATPDEQHNTLNACRRVLVQVYYHWGYRRGQVVPAAAIYRQAFSARP